MTLVGTAVAEAEVVVTKPGRVSIELTDAGEIRRLGRILLGHVGAATGSDKNGVRTDKFANDLIAALGFTVENTAKQ